MTPASKHPTWTASSPTNRSTTRTEVTPSGWRTWRACSPNYATDLALGGATPIAMVQNAVMAIEAGMANTVLCVHARKRGTPDPSPGNPIRHGDEHWEEPWGHFSAVANHAFAAQRHMHDFGTTSEDLAHVAVATRKHACMNDNATMRKPMTIADHQASRYIVDPLRLFDCALESDGGGAVIVTSAERARDFPKRPVAILGMGQHHPHFSLMDAPSLTTLGGKKSSELAYKMAGLSSERHELRRDLRLLHDHDDDHAWKITVFAKKAKAKISSRTAASKSAASCRSTRTAACSRKRTSKACCT